MKTSLVSIMDAWIVTQYSHVSFDIHLWDDALEEIDVDQTTLASLRNCKSKDQATDHRLQSFGKLHTRSTLTLKRMYKWGGVLYKLHSFSLH